MNNELTGVIQKAAQQIAGVDSGSFTLTVMNKVPLYVAFKKCQDGEKMAMFKMMDRSITVSATDPVAIATAAIVGLSTMI